MKQTLQLKLAQHLTLTPQLQQSIRLLQLSTLELNQELEKFLNEHPLLERADIPEDLPPIPTSVLARTDEAFSREQQLQADRTPELGGDGNPESGFDHPSEGDGPLQDDNWGMEASYGSRNNRDDDDDGAFLRPGRLGTLHEQPSDRYACDGELVAPAVVRLNEYSDGVGCTAHLDAARRSTDSGLVAVGHHAGAAAN